MPIRHHVRPDGIVVVERWGSLSIPEENASLQTRLADPAIVRGAPVLVDSSQVVQGDSIEVVKHLASVARATAERLECGAVALVVASDVEYGMARMYMGLTEVRHPRTEVFRGMEEALDWLKSQPMPARPETPGQPA